MEYQTADTELKRMEKEEETLKDLLIKETSIVESRKRMLEQSIQRTDKLRNETEKTRTELKQLSSFSKQFVEFQFLKFNFRVPEP